MVTGFSAMTASDRDSDHYQCQDEGIASFFMDEIPPFVFIIANAILACRFTFHYLSPPRLMP